MKDYDKLNRFLNSVEAAVRGEEYLRWTAYAEKLLRIYRLSGKFTGQEIFNELVDRVISGKRIWKEELNLSQYVIVSIKSLIDNHYKKEQRFVGTNNINENEPDESLFDNNSEIFRFPFEEIELKEIEELFLNACQGDDEAGIVLTEIIENKKNKEIAENLGITINEVKNIKKRLRRKISKQLYKLGQPYEKQ